jgi:small-conductance mechanosensitive channel
MNAWLSLTFLDNSLQNWLIAMGWLVLVIVSVSLARRLLAAWLSALAARITFWWDEALLNAVQGTRQPLVFLVALYPAVQSLTLPAAATKWLLGAATVALFLQIGLWAARFLDYWIRISRERAKDNDPATATGLAAMSFLARLALWSLVLLLLLDNLGFNVTTLVAGLGVGGIAIGFAMQNILADLFSSLSIVLDKPFQIGHFIVVDKLQGTVENIGLKTTRVRSLSGELLVFSNTDLTKARLRNYKHMQERRILFSFAVAHDTPLEQLRDIPQWVRQVVDALPQARFDRAHLKDFSDIGFNYEVVYWMRVPDYLAYMDTQQAINFGLLQHLHDNGVQLAQPVRVLRGQAQPTLRREWAEVA